MEKLSSGHKPVSHSVPVGGEHGPEGVGEAVHHQGAGAGHAGHLKLEPTDQAGQLIACELTLLTDDEDGAGVWTRPGCQLSGELKQDLSALQDESGETF